MENKKEFFLEHIKYFLKNFRLFKKGEDVFKPKVKLSPFYGSERFGLFIDVVYKRYDKDRENGFPIYFNYMLPIYKSKGKYVTEELPIQFRKFIKEEDIIDVIQYMQYNLGKDFYNKIYKEQYNKIYV